MRTGDPEDPGRRDGGAPHPERHCLLDLNSQRSGEDGRLCRGAANARPGRRACAPAVKSEAHSGMLGKGPWSLRFWLSASPWKPLVPGPQPAAHAPRGAGPFGARQTAEEARSAPFLPDHPAGHPTTSPPGPSRPGFYPAALPAWALSSASQPPWALPPKTHTVRRSPDSLCCTQKPPGWRPI